MTQEDLEAGETDQLLPHAHAHAHSHSHGGGGGGEGPPSHAQQAKHGHLESCLAVPTCPPPTPPLPSTIPSKPSPVRAPAPGTVSCVRHSASALKISIMGGGFEAWVLF